MRSPFVLMPHLDAVAHDVKVAVRQLSKNRLFAAVAIVTITLGVGATTTFFSILNGLVFRPLPLPSPDRLVSISRLSRTTGERTGFSATQFPAVRDTLQPVAAAAAHVARSMTLSDGDLAESITGAEVSGAFFEIVGQPLALGRPMTPDPSGSEAVISHRLWTRRYGAATNVLGRVIRVDERPRTIVGVAGPDISLPAAADAWISLDGRRDQRVSVVARLAGPDLAPAAEAALLSNTELVVENPAGNWTVSVIPLREAIMGSKQRNGAGVLLAAATIVLLVACVNLAGLFVAHVSRRRHEMAVRSAMGATRSRLARQLMTEATVVAIAGALLGILLAQWGIDLFVATLGKPAGADWLNFDIDGRVVLFAVAIALVAAVVFAALPSLGASRADPRRVLDEERHDAPAPRALRFRNAILVTQVALSLALLMGGASVMRSAAQIADADPGFDRAGLVVVRTPLRGERFDALEERMAFAQRAREEIRRLPGVRDAGLVSHAPLVDRNLPAAHFVIEGTATAANPPYATLRSVDDRYFRTAGIPLRQGRTFEGREAIDPQTAVIVVNETMARRHWPQGTAVGGRLRLPGAANPNAWFTVVGVVGDVAQRTLPGQPENQIYFALPGWRDLAVVARTSGDPVTVIADIRRTLATLDPSVAAAPYLIDAVYGEYQRDRNIQGMVLGALAALAVLVAALGIFGVTSIVVVERSRELAIRIAVGGTPRGILSLVVGAASRLAALGIAVGLPVSFAVTGFLSTIFTGIEVFDLPLVGAAAFSLLVVCCAAAWLPAWRACQVDPIAALKA